MSHSSVCSSSHPSTQSSWSWPNWTIKSTRRSEKRSKISTSSCWKQTTWNLTRPKRSVWSDVLRSRDRKCHTVLKATVHPKLQIQSFFFWNRRCLHQLVCCLTVCRREHITTWSETRFTPSKCADANTVSAAAKVKLNLVSDQVVTFASLLSNSSWESLQSYWPAAVTNTSSLMWNKREFRCLCLLQTWRPFCNEFEGLVEDFNYGTLLRLDCEKDYTEENTIFGMFTSHCRKN